VLRTGITGPMVQDRQGVRCSIHLVEDRLPIPSWPAKNAFPRRTVSAGFPSNAQGNDAKGQRPMLDALVSILDS